MSQVFSEHDLKYAKLPAHHHFFSKSVLLACVIIIIR